MAKEKIPDAGKRGPGRPAVHTEPWSRINIILMSRQVVRLDRLATDIREATGAALNRTEIIRAILEAATTAGIDFTAARSEEDIRSILASKIRPAR